MIEINNILKLKYYETYNHEVCEPKHKELVLYVVCTSFSRINIKFAFNLLINLSQIVTRRFFNLTHGDLEEINPLFAYMRSQIVPVYKEKYNYYRSLIYIFYSRT